MPFLSVIILLGACSSSEDVKNIKKIDGSLTVYSTMYPLKSFAEKIGGEYVSVESVIPLGADAHTFEPSLRQMQDIADADVFLYTSDELETYAAEMADSLTDNDVTLIETAHRLETEEHETHSPHDEGEHENESDQDPHVWLDPLFAIEMAEQITEAFATLMPEQRTTFETNLESIKTELLLIDEEFQAAIDSSNSKEILVSHAAYGYWEQRYGIEQIAVSGLSPSNEPSQKELTELIKLAKEHNIQYVIFEQNVSSKISEVIQNEIGAKPLHLHNLSVLTDEDVQNQDDYFTLMRRNIETLKKALH